MDSDPLTCRLLSAAVESCEEGVLITDARLEPPGPAIVFANAAITRMTGYPRDELLGRTPRLFQGPRTSRAVLDRLKRELGAGGSFLGETVNYRRDGAEYVLEWHVAAVRDDAGRATHYVSVQRDVTALRRAEAELATARRRQREAAEHSERLLRELDHRVHNNLAGLLGLVSVLRDRAASPGEFADALEPRVRAMAHVHRLLGSPGAAPDAGGLRRLVDALLAEARQLAAHEIQVTVDGPDVAVPRARMLPLMMTLFEWFNNSRKYGAHSSPAGRLSVTWELVPGGAAAAAGPLVRLRWAESGAPPAAGPAVPGLGTELVHMFATHELRGRCRMTYPAGGAQHALEFTAAGPGPQGAAAG